MSKLYDSWSSIESIQPFLKSIPDSLIKDKVIPVVLSDQIAKNLRNIILKQYKVEKKFYAANVSTCSIAIEYNKNELLTVVNLDSLLKDLKVLSKRFPNETALIYSNVYTNTYDLFINKLEFFNGSLIDYADELNKVWDNSGNCWGFRIKG